MWIFEPARHTPIACEVDLCVVGGSCTGVFAAVRAARLGLSVALIEQNVLFGGMATAALVNEWHSTRDVAGQKTIIGGLTQEVMARLRKRGVVSEMGSGRIQWRFNAAELALELDALVRNPDGEKGFIRPFLAARCVGAIAESRGEKTAISGVFIEDRSGRRAIRARFWVDASGDGVLLRAAGLGAWKNETLQPVNLQALQRGWQEIENGVLDRARKNWADEFGYPHENAAPWPVGVSGADELRNVFGPRLNGVDASDADQYTHALLEGRRMQRALCLMLEKESGQPFSVVAHAHALGVRQTWQACCEHRLRGEELLRGEPFFDAIAKGTYPLDIHSAQGTSLRYLDGREEQISVSGERLWTRWRDENESPTCYQIPFRALVPQNSANLVVAGRLLDADAQAFGGARVMVNCNQMGEAAGVAAFLCLQNRSAPSQLDAPALRSTLNAGGSLL